MPRLRLKTSTTAAPAAGEAQTAGERLRLRYLLVAVAGLALSFAFPEPDIAPLAWVAVAPLLWAARAVSMRQGFGLGFVFGFAFLGSLIVWISIVGWAAWVVAVAMEAAFYGAFGAVWALVSRHRNLALQALLAASLWVVFEYVRSLVPFGGFTWGQLAQSQRNVSWLLRSAGIGGGWTVAFIVVAANALLASAWSSVRGGARRRALISFGAATVILVAPLAIPRPSPGDRSLDVAIVQGNVPRDFPGSTFEKEVAIIESHRRLTETVASRQPDLVVWPESSVGIDPKRNAVASNALRSAALDAGAPMLVGGNLDVGSDRYKVMAFEVSPEGDIVDEYQKTHLVPFGEYVPGRRYLDWIPQLDQVPRDAIAGDTPKVFDVAGEPIAAVISYEGDFGSLVRERIGRGARLLVVATNTSTWERSWASAQHVAFSQVRAAENGVWVAHAALSGISAFIDPEGNIQASTPLWTATSLVRTVRVADSVTLYARTGDWLPIGCIVLGLVGAISAIRAGRADTVRP